MVAHMTSHEDAAPAIDIVLADDHAVVRAGLRLLLQGELGMHVIGVNRSGQATPGIVDSVQTIDRMGIDGGKTGSRQQTHTAAVFIQRQHAAVHAGEDLLDPFQEIVEDCA